MMPQTVFTSFTSFSPIEWVNVAWGSKSIHNTRYPSRAAAFAKCWATTVLPTPPLKLLTATRMARPLGRSGISFLPRNFTRRRSSLISANVNQRWRPSSSVSPWGRDGSSASLRRSVSAGTSNINWLISQIENGRNVFVSPGENVARRTAACCVNERSFIA